MFKELRDLGDTGKQKPKDDLAQANEEAQSDQAPTEKPAGEGVNDTAPRSRSRSTERPPPADDRARRLIDLRAYN